MEEPSTIMSLLNTEVVSIKANTRFAAYLTIDGKVICMGRDYRKKPKGTGPNVDLVFGIPK